jgi:restriction system protein
MELSSRLPWALALGLALGSYVGLHWAAVRFATPVSLHGMTDFATVYTHSLISTLAGVFQYILPLALVAGAIVSFVRRSRGVILFNRAAEGDAPAVDGFTWSDFEQVVEAVFRKEGYTVRGNVGGGADGGVDLVLQKGAKQFLVQCKHWRTSSVGVAVIREFFGVMTATCG